MSSLNTIFFSWYKGENILTNSVPRYIKHIQISAKDKSKVADFGAKTNKQTTNKHENSYRQRYKDNISVQSSIFATTFNIKPYTTTSNGAFTFPFCFPLFLVPLKHISSS
jgi:hypothetical protein